MARTASQDGLCTVGTPMLPIPTIHPIPQPPMDMWPTYYPCGGISYLLNGRGIFVDPTTGVGLSIWVDPSLEDLFGLIKSIWKEGGHVSPTHDNVGTQILIISPHQSSTRDMYCHPDRIPDLRQRPKSPVRLPSLGKEEPWQVKIMLDPCWVTRCLEQGFFLGEHYQWAGCRIGGPSENIRTLPRHPAARFQGERVKAPDRKTEDQKSLALLPLPKWGPTNKSLVKASPVKQINGNGSPNVKHTSSIDGNSSNTARMNEIRTANGSKSRSRPIPILQTPPKLWQGGIRIHPPSYHIQTNQRPVSQEPLIEQRQLQQSTQMSQPSQLSQLIPPEFSRKNNAGSSITAVYRTDNKERMAYEVDSIHDDGAGPYESDGEWPTSMDKIQSVTKNTTLRELEEVFEMERMMLGPGIRDNYLVGVLKKKYGTFSHSTWRDLYLSWLYQEGQYSYLKSGNDYDHADELPVESFADDTRGNIAASTRYMTPSTLCWTDVNRIFEKENYVICAAALNADEAGDYLADKYGVYLTTTWRAYLTRWRKQRISQIELESSSYHAPVSAPTPMVASASTSAPAPARTSKDSTPQIRIIHSQNQIKSQFQAGPGLRTQRNRPSHISLNRSRASTPSSSLTEDESDTEGEDETENESSSEEEEDDDLSKIKAGQLEYLSNEMMARVFESRRKKWEKKGFTRVEIAQELEKDLGVYTHGSWQIYYTQWKTRKGRFAYLLSMPKQTAKPRKVSQKHQTGKRGGRPRKHSTLINSTKGGPGKNHHKKLKTSTSRTEFTEEEERAMAEYVVNNNVTTVLPSYLTWQRFAENPGKYPRRTPESYGVHCWRFRDRMERLVAEAKGVPSGEGHHGFSLKPSRNVKKNHPRRGEAETEEDDAKDGMDIDSGV
ncbi:uncharacterized protein L203_105147 [Cryptococcus depauperatus CBS 7841]|uniref:Uncharacterized protein n=1 Tax=Cryptococcus depauperatus CBS 7841 TaxID=1295531 RepID=A0A1E3HV96_9TREE|nr:hypothetical protein L203_05846 [Cryptococcus depauperatus CBS 7841]